MINKKYLLITGIIILVLFCYYGIYLYSKGAINAEKLKISEKMSSDKKFDGLIINNISAYRQSAKLHLKFNIKNKKKNTYNGKNCYVVFIDKNGKLIGKEKIQIHKLYSNNNQEFNIVIRKDESEAYTFVISDE